MKSRNLLVKIVTGILFSLLILSFAVWGIGDIFRGGGQAQAVAEVGDTVIDQRAFAEELSREIGTLSRRLGTPLSGQQVRAFGIPQQVLSRMISRAILDEQAKRQGMLVTSGQMQQEILGNASFQDGTGRFDANRFNLFLRQINMSEQAYLALLGEEIKRQQLTAAVTSAAVAPDSLAEQLFAYRGERRVADYVTIDTAAFTDLGEPDAAVLQATYDSEGGSFMRPSYKEVTLVVLSVDAAAKQVSVSDARVAEAFEARKEQLRVPERRSVSQALLPDAAAAQALADRLAEGADFAAAVEEATGSAPIDLGSVTRDDLPPELAEPVFALSAGQPSAPIPSALGWHLVLVSEIVPAEEPSLEEYGESLRDELKKEEAVNIVIAQANRFDEELASGATLEQAAAALKMEPRRIPAIDDQGRTPADELAEGLPPLNDFLQVLRGTSPGETSTLNESVEGDFFILRVENVIPAEKKPLAEVREDVIRLWRDNEQARLAREKGESIVARLNEGQQLAAVAEAEGLTVAQTPPVTRFQTGQEGLDPRIPPQLFEIDKGEAATFAAPGRQIVVKVTEVLPPDSADREARLGRLTDQLSAALRDDVFQQFLAALQQEFGVAINQRLIDQVVEGF